MIGSCQAGVYGSVGVVVPGGPGPGQPRPGHPVLGEHQVEHRAHQVLADLPHRHPPRQRLAVPVDRVEARQMNQRGLPAGPRDGQSRYQVAEIQVPLAHTVVAVTESQRALRHRDGVGRPVQQHRFERGVLHVLAEIGGGEVLAGHQHAVAFLELDQERQIGVLPHVVDEERNPVVHEAFRQDDVTHRHRQRPVGARRARHPLVGEFRVVGVVGADADHFRSAVTDLGHPVRVGRAGDRNIGAPHHQIRGVPPVPGLRHVGLVAEHLRRGHRQVGVPVVERRHHPADQLDEPGPGRERHHRHRRDRREPGDPVRPVRLDGVHVRGRDHLGGLGPTHPHQPALAAGPLVAPPALAGRPGCRPTPAPGRPAGPWLPGTSRPARRGRRDTAPGSASRCTRKTRRRAGNRAARTRAGPGPPTG